MITYEDALKALEKFRDEVIGSEEEPMDKEAALEWAESQGLSAEAFDALVQSLTDTMPQIIQMTQCHPRDACASVVGSALVIGWVLAESRVKDSDLPDLNFLTETDDA